VKVVLAGGGTAGHVNPLLATAGELRRRQPDCELLVLGTEEGLEVDLVPAAGLELVCIPKVPFPRSVSGQALRFPARFRRAVAQARGLLEQFEPDAVVGFGGYVATPAYLAARRLEIPVVIHEANARPGLANQLGARFAAQVATTFRATRLPRVHLTGMPMRPELAGLNRAKDQAAARAELGLAPDRLTLLVAGGSLGAAHLNQAMTDLAESLLAAGVQVIHTTGRGKAAGIHEALAGVDQAEHYHTYEYCNRMDLAMAAADLAVSRAGAGSVCELACAALPSVLVPLPIGNGEQRHNAADLVEAGGAVLVTDAAFPKWAGENLLPLLVDDSRLAEMSRAADSVALRHGAELLVNLVEVSVSGGRRERDFHLMGAGGVGMAAVAELGLASGWKVSGCDGVDSELLRHLASLGLATSVGHSPDHLDQVTTLIVSSAIKPDNPELKLGRDKGLEVWHRSEALAELAAGRRLLAVAGTHGKTTTSAMAAMALASAGLDPSFAIGAEVLGRGTGAGLGAGDIMVIEADESDGSFLNYRPKVAVVTNVEADHLDHYGNAKAVMTAFQEFISQVETAVIGVDDPGAKQLASWAKRHSTAVVTYGAAAKAQIRLTDLPGRELALSGLLGEAQLDLTVNVPVPGWHMKSNAAAALISAVLLGAEPATALRGIEDFAGTGRRFELKAQVGSVRLFDDYAHHPTEVKVTLAAAREGGDGRLLVVFQPHLYSRTVAFASEFAQALDLADQVWVLDVYGAREDPVAGVSGATITDLMDGSKASFEPDRQAAALAVAAAAGAGDLIMTMGAGDVTQLDGAITKALEERFGQAAQ